MKIEFELDGKPVTAEVDLGAGTVTVDGRRLAFRVVSDSSNRTELEISGELVSVEGWPPGLLEPLDTASVRGEVVRARNLRRSEAAGTAPPATTPSARSSAGAPVPADPASAAGVVPPMPGKVIEVRVKEGERVVKGQVLLVLEAMKMRNEIASPRAGTVHELRATPGANVRAGQVLLQVVEE